MNIDDMKYSEVKELKKQLLGELDNKTESINNSVAHPMLGKRCIIRTYSAGVHFGDIVYANEMEVKLENAYRLWRWENGGLSLSAVAMNGLKKARINKTGEVYLTNAIEMIPVSKKFEDSFNEFVED